MVSALSSIHAIQLRQFIDTSLGYRINQINNGGYALCSANNSRKRPYSLQVGQSRRRKKYDNTSQQPWAIGGSGTANANLGARLGGSQAAGARECCDPAPKV